MNYIKLKQIKKIYFGCEEIAKVFGIRPASARVSGVRLVRNGFLVRVKRNMYVLRDRWDVLSIEDKFFLANIIQVPSYISLMTALDYYEITTQIQRDFIESICVYRTKETAVSGSVFHYNKIDKKLYAGFVKEKGFFIAAPEKAFVDAIYLKSLKRYNFDLSSIDFKRLDIRKIEKIMAKYPRNHKRMTEIYGYFKKA